jgi:hypothetical protein
LGVIINSNLVECRTGIVCDLFALQAAIDPVRLFRRLIAHLVQEF